MIKITADDFCLTELLECLHHENQIFYFESVDSLIGPIQYLGIGEFKIFPSDKTHEIEDEVKASPDLFFIYRRLFENEAGELVLPLFSFFRAQGKIEMTLFSDVNFCDYFSPLAHKINSVDTKNKVYHSGAMSQIPNFEEWEKNILALLDEMNKENASIQKVVLSRKTVLSKIHTKGPINLFLTNYQNQKNAGFCIFSHDAVSKKTFISFTPERLLTYQNGKLHTVSLAGSAPRGHAPSEDQKYEHSLISDQKLQCEQDFVTQDVLERLRPWCENIEVTPMSPLKLSYIQHRKSKLSGKTIHELSINQLINGPLQDLHPTPAVGGLPRNIAREKIKAIEKFPRGLYGAPLGITSLHFTEIAVGIRSCLYDGKTQELTLFGGVGIVPGSDPKREWDEAEIKMSPFLKYIEYSTPRDKNLKFNEMIYG